MFAIIFMNFLTFLPLMSIHSVIVSDLSVFTDTFNRFMICVESANLDSLQTCLIWRKICLIGYPGTNYNVCVQSPVIVPERWDFRAFPISYAEGFFYDAPLVNLSCCCSREESKEAISRKG